MAFIDLHTHSTASDGTLAPAELAALAKDKDLAAVALTDHDTTAGLAEFMAAGQHNGVETIAGCEVSAESGKLRMHILGLWLPPEPGELSRALTQLLEYRNNRNHIVIGKLQKQGVDITYEEVEALAGDGSVGRPHFARVLLEKGVVSSVQMAFDRYLGPKGSAYEPKQKMTAERAISLLKSEGATVILAHPILLGINLNELEQELKVLQPMGLDGIEAYYSEQSHKKQVAYLGLADKLNMVVSGGSDFHGTVKPSISLGSGKGGLRVPDTVLDDLKELRVKQGLPVP
ncbi:MAG: PHP domain-containing protein [Desulfovibrio sp.]|nr:MAG: PHP domain-containing protein [Desulfovibrio sp.]